MTLPSQRQREIRRLRSELLANGFPRLKMLLIVTLTGGSGFLASMIMLNGGVHLMTLRYPAAVGIAYLVFLLFILLFF